MSGSTPCLAASVECLRTYLNGQRAIEVGGPTTMWFPRSSYWPMYTWLKQCDQLNLFDLPESFGSVKKQAMPSCCEQKYSSLIKVPAAQYDVLMSSHMVEHLANPLKLLGELSTKLRPGGLVLSVVPNRVAFWDRARNLTAMEHLIADEEHGIDEGDLSHLDENLRLGHAHPWLAGKPWVKRDIPANMTAEQAFRENARLRVLHHHTFDAHLVRRMHERVGFQTILSFVVPKDTLQIVYLGRLS